MKILVDNRFSGSLSNWFRSRRNRKLIELLQQLGNSSLRIADLGGVSWFWEHHATSFTEAGLSIHVTLFNLPDTDGKRLPAAFPGFQAALRSCNLMDLTPDDLSDFDFIYSNSVIEHLFGRNQQEQFASLVVKSGIPYWIQTPDKYFPLEPHFLMPYWHFWPESWKILWLTHFPAGWYPKQGNREDAIREIRSVQLLGKRELAGIFPSGILWPERVGPLVKSWVVYTAGKKMNRPFQTG